MAAALPVRCCGVCQQVCLSPPQGRVLPSALRPQPVAAQIKINLCLNLIFLTGAEAERLIPVCGYSTTQTVSLFKVGSSPLLSQAERYLPLTCVSYSRSTPPGPNCRKLIFVFTRIVRCFQGWGQIKSASFKMDSQADFKTSKLRSPETDASC